VAFFPKSNVIIIALISTLYDASSLVFVLIKLVYDAGVSLHAIAIALIVMCIAICVAMVYLWSIIPKLSQNTGSKPDERLLKSKEFGTFGFSQTCTLEFACVLAFMAVNMTRSNLYLGMLSPFFDSLSTIDTTTYITIATFMVPAGCLFTPVVDMTISKLGGAGALGMVHLVGAIYSGLNLVPVLWVQLVATGLYGYYRALLFSAVSAFNVNVFGFKSLGRINGVMYTSTGLFSLLIGPSISWAQEQCDNDFTALNLIQLGFLAFSMAFVVALYYNSVEPWVKGKNAIVLEDKPVPSQVGRIMTADPEAALGDWKELLSQMDANDNGEISREEWIGSGYGTTTFAEIDTNGDGRITMDEFQQYKGQM